MVLSVKLGCVAVEGPARTELLLAVLKDWMAGGPTEGPKPTIPAAAIVTVAGELMSGITPNPSAFVPL
jgi:hypothetical protein